MAPRLNTQQMLADMRREQREDHQLLVEKVEAGFASMTKTFTTHELEDTKSFNAIDNRLKVVENTRRAMRWLAGSAILALLGAAAEFLFNHIH